LQDIIDAVLFRCYGVSDEDAAHIKNRLEEMLQAADDCLLVTLLQGPRAHSAKRVRSLGKLIRITEVFTGVKPEGGAPHA
jgi:hypothetical protein